MRFLSDTSYAALIIAARELNKNKSTHQQSYGMWIVLKELQKTSEVDYCDRDDDAELPPGVN